MTLRPLPRPRRFPRHKPLGFTLVELMVALTGGLIFSVAVFALSRDTSRFYQREARVADATLAGIVGFERLRADIARAGYMMSPNIARDPRYCGSNDDSLDSRVARPIISIALLQEGSSTGTDLIEENLGRKPDALILAGNYTTVDDFDFLGVDPGAGGRGVIHLRPSSGGLQRAGYLALPPGDAGEAGAGATEGRTQASVLASYFPAGRAIRIVNERGQHQYNIIESTSPGTDPTITLQHPVETSPVCGVSERTSGTVNTINFIEYSIRSLSGNSSFAALFAPSGLNLPGESTRTELVRQELLPDDATAAFEDTLELIAEYAVDLQFGGTVGLGAGGTITSLDSHGPGSSEIGDVLAPDGTGSPQRARSIRARLSVRSREADRPSNASADERAALGLSRNGVYRFGVGASGAAPFARVRTLQADIALDNQLHATW